jgi:hypothetical protein
MVSVFGLGIVVDGRDVFGGSNPDSVGLDPDFLIG